jgi:hypothetical protein
MTNSYQAAQVIEMLQAATLHPPKLPEAIRALQEMLWKSKGWEAGLSEEAVETLWDLAYDLDCAQDGSPFAENRVVQEITEALGRINRG